MTDKALLDKELSAQVLTVGEYFKDGSHGGIASVLRSYSDCFGEFKFIPSSRKLTLSDKLRYDLGSLFRLGWKLLCDRQIRIVHIHTAAGGSFTKHMYYARLARIMGRKVVLHCHASSFKDWYSALPERKAGKVLSFINSLDCLVVLSASWKEYFLSIGVSHDVPVVLNNITPYPALAGTKDNGDRLKLLFLGEIGQRKGVFDLLEAMSLVRCGAVLDIGGNKMEAELRERISSLGLSDRVVFHGFVSGTLKQELLAGADVFVLPSYNEGLPISILEAMSYGCAIISTPVGGIPEVVRGNGILVKPGDAAAIAGAIDALADASVRSVMGECSREIVKSYYPGSVMASLRSIYLNVLAE